ncbi:MFS transporter [Streptomyces winkii]|uniref:MFS transporter n=1 Tax=Streptomyces winkii TaxID=3051178 RepID=UPI0028D379BE|nr:MFS transporter [Streptomyces sp. DSM 40971]
MRSSSLILSGRAPLAGHYPSAVAVALLALCPYLVLTTAISLMQQVLRQELGVSAFQLQLTVGLSNAAYAFGAVAAADLVQRFPRRHVYLVCESGFVLSSVLVLSAQEISVFATGLVLQGLATGMLLVAALPPLILSHGADRLPTTAAVISLGLFGMVTFGPLVGGLVGTLDGWRYMFTSVAVLAAIGLTIGALVFERNEPPVPDLKFDWLAIPPALGATVLPFFGVAWLTHASFLDPLFLVPVIVGVLIGVLLVVSQYRSSSPLMPVRPVSNTLPVTGVAAAMLVGATFTTLIELTESYLVEVARFDTLEVGALLSPMLPGVVVAAILFRQLLTTRWTPCLALGGLLSVGVGAAVLLGTDTSSASYVVPIASVFLGFGAGAGVTPGLFMAGLSAPAAQIGATFALVELLRSEAAFLVGPALLHLAVTKGIVDGFSLAVTITLVATVAGAVLLVGVYLVGGAALRPPDLQAWITRRSTGYKSPALAARLRKA